MEKWKTWRDRIGTWSLKKKCPIHKWLRCLWELVTTHSRRAAGTSPPSGHSDSWVIYIPLTVLFNKQLALIYIIVSSNKPDFKRFIYLPKMNFSNLCAQNTHIGYLSWTWVFGKKPDLSLEHESLVKNAVIPGVGVDVQGWPHSLYIALSSLQQQRNHNFCHLANLLLEKENYFSKILQLL